MDCKSKNDQPYSIMFPSVRLSWMGNWHAYHFEKLWFMSLVHFFPPTTITQDCLLFEGRPSTKHLHGSYGLCFPFQVMLAWSICKRSLRASSDYSGGLDSLEIRNNLRNIKEVAFLLLSALLDLSVLFSFLSFLSCLLSDRSGLAFQWGFTWSKANQSLWGKLIGILTGKNPAQIFVGDFLAQVIVYLWIISKIVVSRR